MVKSYLRFEQSASFGIVAANSNTVWLPPSQGASSTSAGRALVAGLESVLIWDLKSGAQISKWTDGDGKAEVCYVTAFSNDLVAGGFTDGSIRLWDQLSGDLLITFNGHKSAISCLQFDSSGTRLASGSRDSNIIIWDLVGEVGLYKLRSHRDQVTGLQFVTESNRQYLISTAKDGLIKLWDLDVQQCIETHAAARGECWSLGYLGSTENLPYTTIITAGNSNEVKVWSLDLSIVDDSSITTGVKRIQERGTLTKQSGDRGIEIKAHSGGQFIAIANADRSIEILRIRNPLEVKKSVSRKIKRRKEKGLIEESEAISEDDVVEVFVPFTIIRTPSKLRGFDWSYGVRGNLSILVSLSNNTIEAYDVNVPKAFKKSTGPADYNRIYSIDLAGHRNDIRGLSISSDDKMVASASNGLLKIWNIKTHNCLRTFECGYALCTSFLPGDGFLVVGTKTGELELFDVASSSLVETTQAHSGAVWSLHISADGKSMVTGGADKAVKFWQFIVVQEEIPGTSRTIPRMKLKNTKTLELTDDVLSVRFSPDSKLLAASLLDNTVKVFFADTLKFFLSLYGHKLPVLSMDISFDSKLLITCSADKNIKIWGLDFGDCHRSIFAHQESIMSVVFEPESHNFFSASKDKLIKYWDGDKFENIQKLSGHHSEIWALAIARSGQFLVSGSHDKSIRVWEQTDEPLFLEEEREKELEELYESTLTASLETDESFKAVDLNGLQNDEGKDEDDDNNESSVERVGKQTIESLKAGEKLMEALEIGIADLDLLAEYSLALKRSPSAAPPVRHVILATLKISAQDYVLSVLQKIKPSQLEDSLLVLSFEKVSQLLRFVDLWAEAKLSTPLICRVLFFILKVHQKQIVASQTMRTTMQSLRDRLRSNLSSQKDEIGYNLVGLQFIKQNWQLHHTKEFVDEDEMQQQQLSKAKKRTFVTVA